MGSPSLSFAGLSGLKPLPQAYIHVNDVTARRRRTVTNLNYCPGHRGPGLATMYRPEVSVFGAHFYRFHPSVSFRARFQGAVVHDRRRSRIWDVLHIKCAPLRRRRRALADHLLENGMPKNQMLARQSRASRIWARSLLAERIRRIRLNLRNKKGLRPKEIASHSQ